MNKLASPASDEYAEFYAGYVQRAASKGDVLAALSNQIDEIQAALGNLSDEQALFRDAPKEWSIKEVMGHLNDVERVFSYRLLRVSRNDATPLPGFEQNDYVREAGFDSHPIKDLIQEFEHLRRANILLIQNMSDEAALRVGAASGYPVSARALIYMLVGHVDHHMESLHEKYLPFAK
ncbi:MAG: DinB family protein [Anaerolineales bacterium]|nr:DinB family protein [Anaerolineales bacterium]HNQ94934.1 DinB family protein [Anaerolineales bacterium]